jgi:Raf kinase inhibitor-like YbhB/YbcL family protein
MVLSLESSAFKTNGFIPTRHTCDGEDISPPLAWFGAPKETQSFVLVCTDPDAPNGVFHHWAVYDLPADMSKLSEGFSARAGSGKEATNDFRKVGYGGPCPPRGHGTHHYHFRLSALKAPRLALSPKATCRDVIAAARAQTLETAELIGVYERSGRS